MPLQIRPIEDRDVEHIIALWNEAGLVRTWNDPVRDIARAREVWPDLFLIATIEGHVAGTVMAGYDGHRGWLYYLATATAYRGEGIATALISEAEGRLRALGCPKVMLMVREGNTGVLDMYARLGYSRDASIVAGKRLIVDE